VDVRSGIVDSIVDLLKEEDKPVPDPITDDLVLLESGLDSLGFAVLVARLQDDLGYDPFTLMDDPVYPRTLGEFVAVYAQYAPTQELP
jgi:aryl carrier-like protein